MDNKNPRTPVHSELERVPYNLDSWSMMCGAIGSLMTMQVVPVIAGDSMKVDYTGVFRLSPLRRQMYLDCKIDLYAFYVPYRHIYGQDWIDFMLAGQDEGVALGTDTVSAVDNVTCLGRFISMGSTVPRWLDRGYVQIWNRYFRDPSDVGGIVAEDFFDNNGSDWINYWGLPCCHLKRLWNCALLDTLTTADYRLALNGGEVDLYELSQLQGRLKTEQDRDWFSIRYADLMRHTFSSNNVNIDADKRPELVMHSETWLSGKDVNANDQAALGTWTGKSAGVASLNVPWKFFPEHGTLWIMGLLRFPAIHSRYKHYLEIAAEPTYQEISGDPNIIARHEPMECNQQDYFDGGADVDLGQIPYAQWYREQPDAVHYYYENIAGHPFITELPGTRTATIYIDHDDYDSVFQTLTMKHWQSQAYVAIEAKRFVPDPKASIFAGTGSPAVV